MKLTLKIEYETNSTQYTKEQLAESIQKQLSAGTNVPVTVKIVNYGKVKKERNAWKLACESACKTKRQAKELFNKCMNINKEENNG